MTVSTIHSISPPETGSEADLKDRKLRKACGDFEAVFVGYLMKSMRQTLPGDALFDSGIEKDIYESMYDQQIAEESAKGKGLGIGDALYRQLKGVKLK